jgi:K+-sensing histidine kinase KdpD
LNIEMTAHSPPTPALHCGLLISRARLWLDAPRAAVRVPLRLIVSVVAAAAALALVGALEPVLGYPVFFPAFVGIIFVSAEIAGAYYGMITMALFGAGYDFFYQEPRLSFGPGNPRDLRLLLAYIVAGFILARIGGALRNAYRRVRDEHRAATTLYEQREDLLRMLTHDIRSPLTVITVNAELLAKRSDDPAVVRRAQDIEKSAGRVAGMLGDLIDLAYLESGHIMLERKPLDVAGFVSELRRRLEGTLPIDRVTFDVPEGLPAAAVDAGRFERILVNLLSNALKYAPPPAPILLRAAVQGGEVVVSVAAGGPGISQLDLPRLFEKYFRASGTRGKEGLGIGLYATRLLVQAHGGRIWVDSTVGKGTTFYVALPTARPEGQRGAPGASSGAPDDAVVPPKAE